MFHDVAFRRRPPVGMPLLNRMHDDEPAFGARQRRIHRLLGKAANVVEKGRAMRERMGLRLRMETIDRDAHPLADKRVENRREPPDFLLRRDRLCIRVAR